MGVSSFVTFGAGVVLGVWGWRLIRVEGRKFSRISRDVGCWKIFGEDVDRGWPGEKFRHAAVEVWWKCRWLCVDGGVCVDDVGLG